MTDLKKFLGCGTEPGQAVDIYLVGLHVADGAWQEVSHHRVSIQGEIRATRKPYRVAVEIHEGSKGKPSGTCTVVVEYDGFRRVDENAKFWVDRYWINIDTQASPNTGRYAIWRNQACTDFTVPAAVRLPGRIAPRYRETMPTSMADYGVDPELTGPPAEEGEAGE